MGELPGLIATAVAADAQFGVRPTFVIGWADGQGVPDLTSDSEPSNNTWSNAETRTEFTDMVVDLATSYQPEYLALANELDIWWEAHPGDLDQWLSLYSSVYDAVKAVSPQTKVYATFQYENLQGLGSFGAASWSAFDAMTSTLRLDLAAFTSYPYFEHASPSSIPSSYYDEIGLHWSGPVAFTEIGWLSAPSFPYPGSEMDQAAFVTQFFTRSAAYDLEFVQWLFLHDFDGQAAFPPFVGIGLRSNDASVVRPADAVWQAQVALREP